MILENCFESGVMKRIFIELDYDGDLSDLAVSHELESLLNENGYMLRRFNCVDSENLFNLTVGKG